EAGGGGFGGGVLGVDVVRDDAEVAGALGLGGEEPGVELEPEEAGQERGEGDQGAAAGGGGDAHGRDAEAEPRQERLDEAAEVVPSVGDEAVGRQHGGQKQRERDEDRVEDSCAR